MRIDDTAPGNVVPVGEHAPITEAAIARLVLVRRLDGLTYRFDRELEQWNGQASYRRVDPPLWIRWTGLAGWAVVDAEGVANGWPMSGAMEPATPPVTSWRSEKGDKSYLYDLRDPVHHPADESEPGQRGSGREAALPGDPADADDHGVACALTHTTP
jgi:hypothetical protein